MKGPLLWFVPSPSRRLLFLVFFLRNLSLAAGFSPQEVMRTYILVDSQGVTLGQCSKLTSLDNPAPEEEEDEVERLFPTSRQRFCFGAENKLVTIRTTSFGCGKMGHQIWPSSIALSLYLQSRGKDSDQQRQVVLELGAGCGLPSLVCRDVLPWVESVIATDFWSLSEEPFDKDRLVPQPWHGINLEYNVQQHLPRARVERLDWHSPSQFASIKEADLVIGSDLIYYPMDVQPLWSTLQHFLDNNGATTKEALLVFPLDDTREALPEFLQVLREQQDAYDVDTAEMTLHRDSSPGDIEHFLVMSVAKSALSQSTSSVGASR
jgi:predicted nicotinamide N-methyase